MKTIETGQTLTARSIGDHDCIFKLTVIERRNNFAYISQDGEKKRVKIRIGIDGNEYLRPDSYSFAPMFKAN